MPRIVNKYFIAEVERVMGPWVEKRADMPVGATQYFASTVLDNAFMKRLREQDKGSQKLFHAWIADAYQQLKWHAPTGMSVLGVCCETTSIGTDDGATIRGMICWGERLL